MPAAENIAAMHRLYDEAFNQGRVDVIDDLMDPAFVDHDAANSTRDVAGLKQFVNVFRAAFPDGRFTVEDTLTDGEKVVCRFSVTGIHRGEFMGIPSTGNTLEISGIDIIRFANGKAIEHWGEFDGLGMLRQLGVMPSAG